MQQIKKMGNIKSIMGMIPGMSKFTSQLDEIDDNKIFKVEAIVYSMTPKERQNPTLMAQVSRRKRIANGSGHNLDEINKFVKSFEQMRDMMHKMSKMGPGGMPGMPGMGMPKFPRR
jgi:signal recognition particle subunit SRP54